MPRRKSSENVLRAIDINGFKNAIVNEEDEYSESNEKCNDNQSHDA